MREKEHAKMYRIFHAVFGDDYSSVFSGFSQNGDGLNQLLAVMKQ